MLDKITVSLSYFLKKKNPKQIKTQGILRFLEILVLFSFVTPAYIQGKQTN
jgi:hypothetical protein